MGLFKNIARIKKISKIMDNIEKFFKDNNEKINDTYHKVLSVVKKIKGIFRR